MPPLAILLASLAINGTLTYASLTLLPTPLLRLTPIVSATASLVWAYDEHTSFSAWMDPSYRAQADALLPRWFANWAAKANYVLFSTFPVSISVGLANVLSYASSTSSTSTVASTASWSVHSPRLWYAAGAFFALAHMFFGPRALGLLAEIQQKGQVGEGGIRASSTDAMGRWLVMHAQRTPVTDLPALLCFVAGACLELQGV